MIPAPHSMQLSGPGPTPLRGASTEANVSRFDLRRGSRTVACVLWAPVPKANGAPLVLVQHGGSGHKADASVLELAERLVAEGLAVAAIDGPIHGDRRHRDATCGAMSEEFLTFWRDVGGVDQMVGDWLALIEHLSTRAALDVSRLGWCGLSMGTAYGLPVLAASHRFAAAVIGKWSPSYPNSAHLVSAAMRVKCPTLFIQHWHDELFDRDGVLSLFDSLGAVDKRLHVYAGGHFGRSAEELAGTVTHLVRHLKSPTAPKEPIEETTS